jgi:competence protein CoiA
MMQLRAFNEQGEIIPVVYAKKGQAYLCLECGKEVRPRNSERRHPHFFHIPSESPCRQKEKTAAHLHLQYFLQKQIGPELSLEVPFPSMARIADAVWEKEKIVFEVQVSPMSSSEMLSRVADYRSLGYEIVWILSDTLYNRPRVSAMEAALVKIPHYFSNMNSHGEGIIYDQWESRGKGLRKILKGPLPIDITRLRRPFGLSMLERASWPLGFKGDVGSLNPPLSISFPDPFSSSTRFILEKLEQLMRAFLRLLPHE